MIDVNKSAQHAGKGVLIALHGHGGDPASASSWGRRIAPAGWDVVAPEAQRDRDGTRSWFDTGPRGVDDEQLASSMRQVERLVEGLSQRGRAVIVAGFSQGGALALSMAWEGTAADLVISICGFFPESERTRNDGHLTPVLVVSNSDDELVPPFLGQDAAAMLQDAGFEVETIVARGGHRITVDDAAIAHGFIQARLGRQPRFSLAIPVDRVDAGAEFVSGEGIGEISSAYERLGFHAGYVTDHPAPDDRWLAGGGHHGLEPTVALTAAAAATTTLMLHTNVYVLPYRNPFLAAKALASVDVLSSGRLIVGAAAGYVRPEFAALGADFDGRGALLEESLKLLPEIWRGESVTAYGGSWTSRGATSLPATSGSPPIWVGGNSRAAMRRAIDLAQGWSPMPTPAGSGKGLRTTEITSVQELAARMDEATEMADERGRTAPLTVCFVPFGLGDYLADPGANTARLAEEVEELLETGVDWLALAVAGSSRAEVIDRAGDLAMTLGLGPTGA